MRRFHLLLLALALIPTCELTAQTEAATSASQRPNRQRPTVFWPEGTAWNQQIPTPREHFGFEVGFRHLRHDQVVSYARAVAAASDRVQLSETGQTHGGRPLLLLTISSPRNLARLDEVQTAHRQLTQPAAETPDFKNLPAIINMGYGVHGDEPSATHSAVLALHYLAAARGKEIQRVLDSCIILLDPCLNPDGFNRFSNWVNRYRGKNVNDDPQHAEHSQQWPPGRVNYYWFDLNRDWLPLVHPESQARMDWYHAWKPNVVLDFHEMGTGSTYFFQPGIPQRTNPLTPARNLELTRAFARYHAASLDKRGSLYFTEEQFDDFYMGKGSTYPDLHGAVGILFEQASSRGHVQRNQDGPLRFRDTIANQFTTTLSSLAATADLREELLEHKRNFYREAIEMAEASETQSWVFSCPDNPTRLKEFADTLLRHDIACYRVKQPTAYGDRTLFPERDLIVPARQPEFRFLQSLLMRKTDFEENIFYDVSAWTLPLAFGLEETELTRNLDPDQLVPCELTSPPSNKLGFTDDDLAYLIDWRNDRAVSALQALLQNEVKVRVAKQPFTIGDGKTQERFPEGTLAVPLGVQRNRTARIRRILQRAHREGLAITPVSTGMTPDGIDLGSNNFPVVPKQTVAMLTGPSISAYSAGELWHHLDTRVGMAVTLLKDEQWGRLDLTGYSTLILPRGRYADWSATDIEKLKDFVRGGGNLIAVDGSTDEVAKLVLGRDDFTISEEPAPPAGFPSPENPYDPRGARSAAAAPADNGDAVQKPFASARNTRALELISGAIFQTRIDPTHPLMYGQTSASLPVFRSHTTFLKPSDDPYSNPAIYDSETPLLAGYCSEQNQQRASRSASVVVYPLGAGQVILIADNPTFRGFWHGTGRILTNAIFFGSETRP